MIRNSISKSLFVSGLPLFFLCLTLFSLPAQASAKIIYLTTTGAGTWTVPIDWNSASNTIEVIGGGGGGAAGTASVSGGQPGGGGGAYSEISNLALTHGTTVTVQIGAAGTGGAFHSGFSSDQPTLPTNRRTKARVVAAAPPNPWDRARTAVCRIDRGLRSRARSGSTGCQG